MSAKRRSVRFSERSELLMYDGDERGRILTPHTPLPPTSLGSFDFLAAMTARWKIFISDGMQVQFDRETP